MTYERDAICYPMDLVDGSNNRLVVVENPAGSADERVIDLDAGRYFHHTSEGLHSDTDVDGGEYRGLYYAVAKLLTDGTTAGVGSISSATTNDSYAFEVITPTDSEGYVDGGVRIRAVKAGGAVRFQLRFEQDLVATPWSTVDARWFGAKAESGTNFTSVADGDDEILEMPGAILGRLATQTASPSGRARDKRRVPYKDVRRSVPVPRDSRNVKWDSGHRRRFIYEKVWGALVYTTRPADAPFASVAKLATDDFNFGWERVWDALTDGDRVLVAHNNAGDFDVGGGDYEVGKLESSDEWGRFARVTGDNGDFHTISFELWVDQDMAEYSH